MRHRPLYPQDRYEHVATCKDQVLRVLDIIGFIRYRNNKTIRWPFSAPPKWQRWRGWARIQWNSPWRDRVGLFRNLPHVVKWERGRLLPRRWGFTCFGFEFGDRGGLRLSLLPNTHRPCGDCPWRKDAKVGYWHRDHFVYLVENCQGDGLGQMGCRKQDGNICAGWAAVVGYDAIAPGNTGWSL